MSNRFIEPAPPSEDKRWETVTATMRLHGYTSDCLIETLHTVQQNFGYISVPALHFVANSLRVPLSRAYGVATFYHLFRLTPPGKHTCLVCLGTTCHLKQGPQLLEAVEDVTHIHPGETTADGEVSLLTARCVGACWLAPLTIYDEQTVGYDQPDNVRRKVLDWMGEEGERA
jgi:bidirectional [NiFe] hydrogenase diaphorase subunit